MKMTAEERVLTRMGVDFHAPHAPAAAEWRAPSALKPNKYDVSVAIGELELYPAVRNASADSLIVADGFSCREQIRQCAGRRTMHLAEVIRLALDSDAIN